MNNPNALINSDYGPIIININDSGVGKNISQTGYHSKGDIHLIENILNFLYTKKQNLIFYDVGANIGTHSLAIAKIYGDKIKIRAFEAQRQVFNMLCGTVALNGLQNVYCHNLAIGENSGELLEISVPNYNKTNNFGGLELINPVWSDNHNMIKKGLEVVLTATLDDFEEEVDFIKMDIEGMEDKAFRGARKLIHSSKPICFVETLKTDVKYLTEFFVNMGYIGFKKDDELIAIPLHHQIQINQMNRLF